MTTAELCRLDGCGNTTLHETGFCHHHRNGRRDAEGRAATLDGEGVVDRFVEFSSSRADRELRDMFVEAFDVFQPGNHGRIKVVYAVGNQAKGGHFSLRSRGPRPKRPSRRRMRDIDQYREAVDRYRERVNKYNNTVPHPEIRVVARNGSSRDEVRNIVFHELAHAADWEGGSSFMEVASRDPRHEGLAAPVEGASPAFNFLAVAKHCESLKEFLRTASFDHYWYSRDPKELWARAVAQWTDIRLGGDGQRGASRSDEPGYQHAFSPDEVDELAPYIEAVLERNGLLR